MKILVIDDEEMIRTLTQHILSKAGFTPLIADSGQAGLTLLKANTDISAAIVDHNMADLNGIETIREIFKIAPNTKCLLSTGNTASSVDIPTELKTQIHFLQKPYRAQELVTKLREVLTS